MGGDPRLDGGAVPHPSGRQNGDGCGKVGVGACDLVGPLATDAEHVGNLGEPDDGCSHENQRTKNS